MGAFVLVGVAFGSGGHGMERHGELYLKGGDHIDGGVIAAAREDRFTLEIMVECTTRIQNCREMLVICDVI